MITFAQAKQRLAQYAGNGLYPDDANVGMYINQAVERLMNKPQQWAHTTQNLIMCAPNGQLTLPREVAKVIKCRVNGVFAEPQSRWFEYYSNGAGLLGRGCEMSPSHFVDRGFVPLQYDIPLDKAYQLCVVSDREEDADCKMLVRGIDETGREVKIGSGVGEMIPIRGNGEMWVSESTFSSVLSIQKPVTKGYVYVSAINRDDGTRYILGSIHPDETIPMYRRYFVNETPCTHPKHTDGTYCVPTPYRIDALCKLQYVPLVHDSDILTIQNIGALKFMMIALRLEDAEKLDDAQKYEASAERLMNEQTNNLENDETTINISPSFRSAPVEALI